MSKIKFSAVVFALSLFSLLIACDDETDSDPVDETESELEADSEDETAEIERDGLQVRIQNRSSGDQALVVTMDEEGQGTIFCYSDGTCEEYEGDEDMSTMPGNRTSTVIAESESGKVAVGVESKFTVEEGEGMSRVHAGRFQEIGGGPGTSFENTQPVHLVSELEEGAEITVTYGEIHD